MSLIRLASHLMTALVALAHCDRGRCHRRPYRKDNDLVHAGPAGAIAFLLVIAARAEMRDKMP
jgi:hypothetical protein